MLRWSFEWNIMCDTVISVFLALATCQNDSSWKTRNSVLQAFPELIGNIIKASLTLLLQRLTQYTKTIPGKFIISRSGIQLFIKGYWNKRMCQALEKYICTLSFTFKEKFFPLRYKNIKKDLVRVYLCYTHLCTDARNVSGNTIYNIYSWSDRNILLWSGIIV